MYIHPIDESIDYRPTIHNHILRKRVKDLNVNFFYYVIVQEEETSYEVL